MTWTAPVGPASQDPVTGYQIPGVPGMKTSVLCRFHLGGTKQYKNADNTVTYQVGRIRLDVGSEMPPLNGSIEVDEIDELSVSGDTIQINGATVSIIKSNQFTGTVKDIFRGQKTWRIDV